MARLRIDLHLEDDGLVHGIAWTYYNPSDSMVACEAHPGIKEPMVIDTATDWACQAFLDACGHQLAF